MSGLFETLAARRARASQPDRHGAADPRRAGREAVPNELMAAYYAQRASAGLIITEATGISREGLGWPNAPGLWNGAQVEGWKVGHERRP